MLRSLLFCSGGLLILSACATGNEIPEGSGGNSPSTSSQGGGGPTTGTGQSSSSTTATTSSTTTSSTTTTATTTTGAGGGSGGCGDGMAEVGEDCDGADLDGSTCTNIGQGFTGGSLSCNGDCTLNTSACTAPPSCGNGVLDAGEQCDGALLGGASCSSQGFQTGTLSCTGGCMFNLQACSTCGDGSISGTELCDGTNFNGQSCSTMGFSGGGLSCQSCTSINTANCYTCGNGVVTGAEVCDGANLGGQTCQSAGFGGGTLSCNANCLSLNTSQCVGECQPLNPAPVCGIQSCIPAPAGQTASCNPAGAAGTYGACFVDSDCQATNLCVDTGDIFGLPCCLRFCITTADCGVGSSCTQLNTPLFAGGQQYGVCYDGLGGC